MKRSWLAILMLAAACQPEAHRLLLVDFTLADPLTLETTAAPWHDAGYRVEYRRFYPHLTRADLARYRTVVVLAGREPERTSDALTIGDLAILTEWIRRDGVVVLAYEPDLSATREAGTLDRWIMNRWLAAQGSGITIGDDPVDVPAVPLPSSSLDNAGFAPFPAGRNHPLSVRNHSQMLARGTSNALVAASRVGDGLIVVASRNLLAAAREDPRTRDFLVALARWTRRPAEWATVDAAERPAPLRLANAPKQILVHAPLLAPPAGADAMLLPEPVQPLDREDRPLIPPWITRQGLRVLWSRYNPQSFESSLDFAETAALNALVTVIPAPALADTMGTRNIWRSTAEELQTTSFRWFPGVALIELPSEGDDEIDRHGDLTPVPCGLDSLFWRSSLRPAYRTLARLGGAHPDVLAGVALDLDSAMTPYADAGSWRAISRRSRMPLPNARRRCAPRCDGCTPTCGLRSVQPHRLPTGFQSDYCAAFRAMRLPRCCWCASAMPVSYCSSTMSVGSLRCSPSSWRRSRDARRPIGRVSDHWCSVSTPVSGWMARLQTAWRA